jgi:hypothetical protein
LRGTAFVRKRNSTKYRREAAARVIKFSELVEDALKHGKANNRGQQFDGHQIGRLVEEFENRNADGPVEDFRCWFNEQNWESGAHNRDRSTLSLMYRLGVENSNVTVNPARLLKHNHEDNRCVAISEPA